MSEEEKAAAESPNAAEAAQSAVDKSADDFYESDEPKGEKPEGEKVEEKKAAADEPKSDDDEKQSKEEDEEKSDKEDSKVPEKYEFEVDDDEPITDAQLVEIAEYSKKQGLTQEQAQEIVNMQSKALQDVQAEQAATISKAKEAWADSSKSDSEFGGDKFPENIEKAKRVIDRFGTDDFKEALDESGLGNHPELLRVFVRIGKAMSEDTLVHGDRLPAVEKSTEDLFYGGNNINNN